MHKRAQRGEERVLVEPWREGGDRPNHVGHKRRQAEERREHRADVARVADVAEAAAATATAATAAGRALMLRVRLQRVAAVRIQPRLLERTRPFDAVAKRGQPSVGSRLLVVISKDGTAAAAN